MSLTIKDKNDNIIAILHDIHFLSYQGKKELSSKDQSVISGIVQIKEKENE